MHTIGDLGTILSIWAHPDDETYLAGGVMAAAADSGQRVVCVSATAGERGTTDPEAWPPARLERVRRWETAAAMAVLGISEHRILDLPDGDLAADDERGAELVGALVDEIRPDTILTFGPDGITYHPDHIAIGRLVSDAWRTREYPCRLFYPAPTVEHLARFGGLYEEWGVYMTEERPAGVEVGQLALRVALEGSALDR
jgi:LmbE family N-acetylglucosaminyl deacetylase